jgi:hypothetical protein
MAVPIFEIELPRVPIGAVHKSGHEDMTTIEDLVTTFSVSY